MAPSIVDTDSRREQNHFRSDDFQTKFRYTETETLRNAVKKASADFRSDVVTVPTEQMMQVGYSQQTIRLLYLTILFAKTQAILDASVGDDIYDTEGDDSVNALQNKLAKMSGKEAALWTVSGTMGNQICLRTHLTQPPHSVLLDHRAHVQCWESGALPVFSQASVIQVHPGNGIHLTLNDVKRNIIRDGNSKLNVP